MLSLLRAKTSGMGFPSSLSEATTAAGGLPHSLAQMSDKTEAADAANQQVQQLEGELKGTRAKLAEALANIKNVEADHQEQLVQINLLEDHFKKQQETLKEQGAQLCQVGHLLTFSDRSELLSRQEPYMVPFQGSWANITNVQFIVGPGGACREN
jgi:DNA repair ATPase RecN